MSRATSATRIGVLLPDASGERPQRCEVVAVGNGRMTDDSKRVELDVSVGSTVLFAEYAGTECKHEDGGLRAHGIALQRFSSLPCVLIVGPR